jgi:hypothetical protein
MAKYPVEVISQKDDSGRILYGFCDANDNGGGLDYFTYDDETGDEQEIEWVQILAKHLADGWVAIIMEVGHEKYRYFNGYAIAINSKGETRELNLNDIILAGKELGENVTGVGY